MKLSHTEKLLSIMAQLRHPETGCAWDLKQNFKSLIPYIIEEAYEVVDAIERNNIYDLQDELGDLLLQVVFQAQIAEEQGLFTFENVAESISHKLISRHAHVFGDVTYKTDADRQRAWEESKIQERKIKDKTTVDKSILEGIAHNLPALIVSEKIQNKAAHVGFDWQTVEPVFDKVQEELDEIKDAWQSGNQAHIQEEVGDLLFVTVNLARHLQVKPEIALIEANKKFIRRFQYIEQQLQQSDRNITETKLAELDLLWDEAKKKLKTT